MPKTIRLQAHEPVVIYRRNFSSVPTDVYFEAVTLDGDPPQGEVEIRGSHWVLPKPARSQPLQAQNRVHAGFWDTFFSITVVAYTPLAITFPTPKNGLPYWLLGAIALLVAISVLIVLLAP